MGPADVGPVDGAPGRPDLRRHHKAAKAAAYWASSRPGVWTVSLQSIVFRGILSVQVNATTEWGVVSAVFAADVSRDVQAEVQVAVFRVLDHDLALQKAALAARAGRP